VNNPVRLETVEKYLTHSYVNTIVPINCRSIYFATEHIIDVPTQAFYPQLIIQALTTLWRTKFCELSANQDRIEKQSKLTFIPAGRD